MECMGSMLLVVYVIVVLCLFGKLWFGVLICVVLFSEWLEDNLCWLVCVIFICDVECKL